MPDLSAQLPSALAKQARWVRLGPSEVPALVIHPDWEGGDPRPVMVWMHGRTVGKELDPGRYLRWMRSEGGGIATCAVDLPGHGERRAAGWEEPGRTLDVIEQMVGEIDGVVESLRRFGGLFDLTRVGIGGMSAGGIVALRRLCDPHGFSCASVESTVGNVEFFFQREAVYPAAQIARVDPLRRVGQWRPVPLLAMHSRADKVAPVAGIEGFIERLKGHYRAVGADEGLVEFRTWQETGAPFEHNGFGRHSAEAKSQQTAFLSRYLLGT
ncbi:MAG: alpha/beta fold hydrolase [Phycisphaerales bacterium]|nr:alpha/beta fold hydrolase [Phycisphaerales bacterium]